MTGLQRVQRAVSAETTGGVLLLIAAAIALFWANSPWRDSYTQLLDAEFGPAALHLNLTVAQWAADGLLAVFFFVVGVELKHEMVAGSLAEPRLAGVPMAAAVGGMVVPAAFYVLIVGFATGGDTALLRGWAIPTATDIAFAVAVLAVFGRGLPIALRTFLLTLAVVDDLLGIIVIAVVYTETINFSALVAALLAVAAFAWVVSRPDRRWSRHLRPLLLVALAVTAWALMHASGVHATVAGVLLGLSVPTALSASGVPRTTTMERAVRPFSTAVAVPLFALLSAGVTIIGKPGGIGSMVTPVAVAVVVGLVVGKVIGVMGTTALVTKLTPLRLPDSVGLRDLLPVGVLTGMGFTVSLLIAELSFPDGPDHDAAKAAILVGTVIAAVTGAFALRWDARKARTRDMNCDGVDDVDIAVIGGRSPGEH